MALCSSFSRERMSGTALVNDAHETGVLRKTGW